MSDLTPGPVEWNTREREQLLLETIRAAAEAGHMRLLDVLTDMLVRHSSPPRIVAGELTE